MLPLTEKQIQTAFINASQREVKNISLPDLGSLDWDTLDYLGWRDRKVPGIGYVVVELDEVPVGILLRQTDAKTRSRAQCSWCEDVTLPNDVVLFGAKRSGQAGRNGNTVGTLICDEFQCSGNVRKLPPVAYLGFDVEAARLQRIENLRVRAARFVRDIRDDR